MRGRGFPKESSCEQSRDQSALDAPILSQSTNQASLAQANRHIAELHVQIVRQRVIIKDVLDTGQRSEMAESLLDALEGSLRIFEKHRIFLLSCSVNRPSKGDHPGAPTRRIPVGAP
jgi:hypothetical protein